ncbi:MAG: hypothetical protein ABMA26_05350 [Limisphaerales bacterium]
MKTPEKSKSRPRTLSEIRADVGLKEVEVDMAPEVVELVHRGALVAVQKNSCYSWGDDGFDPMSEEIVGLFKSETEADRGIARHRIGKGVAYAGGEFHFEKLELPVADEELVPSEGVMHVVFQTRYLHYHGHNDDVWREHPTYRTDGTGTPLLAFASPVAAEIYSQRLTRQAIETGPDLNNDWFGSYGNKLSDFTSLSETDFRGVVKELGIEITEEPYVTHKTGSFPWTFHCSNLRKDGQAQAGGSPAALLWPHLDRLVLFKVVPMPLLDAHGPTHD